MAKINYNETEQKLQLLKEDINPKEIGYVILSAFGKTNTYIKRYKNGKGNMFKPHTEGILIKKSLAYQAVDTLQLTDTLEAMKADEDIKKQNARILAVSDGKTLLAYDTREKESYENKVKKIWLDFQFFYPLAGIERFVITEENPADVKAAEKMARLHNEISRYNEYTSKDDLHDLNVFMMRLLFCFFAEDTGIFEKKVFSDYIHRFTDADGSNLAEKFDEIFNVMDQPQPHRVGLTRVTAQFPYVNGGLFHGRIDIPKMGARSRRLILESGELNWGDINPDIFGSMMQAVVTPNLRSELGMHYTSVPNIMKVIQPLFLNDLEEAFVEAYDNPKKLDELLIRISKIKFFDPACGSGNFLIITYKELRRLEIRIWERIIDITKLRILPFSNISISQFYGIEIDSFAHEIAMLSLWLAEHQMNAEFTKSFANVKIDALPLKNIDTIVEGNACRLNWDEVCPHEPEEEVYVFGNPPYLGARLLDKSQKEDMSYVLSNINGYNNLDYISIWFYLAAKYIEDTSAKYAFVSTNSIMQGEQVSLLWEPIFDLGLEINFAHTSFKWTNNAKHNAGVTCVVVGVAEETKKPKVLYHNNNIEQVSHINAYLAKGSNVIIKPYSKPISKFPSISFGSMPNDNGALILDRYEKDNLLQNNPEAEPLIKKFLGSQEFIRGQERFCLWIEDKDIELAQSIESINQRIRRVYQSRTNSKRIPTQKLSEMPHRFGEVRHRDTHSVIIPRVSSERRQYIPIGYLEKDVVISDSAFALYDAEIWLFGILTSKIHNAWVRAVGGRLKTDMRYSASLCYNTFPFPNIPKSQKEEISALAEEVLMVREHHTEKTLAEMYDPDKMPQDLRDAHTALDLAVDSCYRKQPFSSDEERLEVLFRLYEKMSKK